MASYDFWETLDMAVVTKLFKLTNDELLDKIVKKDAVDIMEQLVATQAFSKKDPDILNASLDIVRSYEMLAVLLRNGLDLVKIGGISGDQTKKWCIKFMLSDTLKVKVNPNAPMGDLCKTPFWRYMITDDTVTLGYIKIFANGHENLTEPLDVNAVNKDGNTHLHVRRNPFPEIFDLNPNLEIKNSSGRNVIEDRDLHGYHDDAFNRYRYTNEKVKKLEELLSTIQAELNKTKEKLKNIESVLS